VTVLLSLWLAACSVSNDTDAVDTAPVDTTPLALDPRERGPYEVGFRRETFDITTPDGRSRSLTLHVWYPTEATEGPDPAYTSSFPPLLDGIVADVPVATSPWADGRFPVVLHSHGHQATGGSAQPIAWWLVRHGWVVAAPDHAPDLFATIVNGQESTPPEHYADRPNDLTATLDHLEQLPPGDALAGKLRTEGVLATGHSRGTYTMWAVGGATYTEGAAEAHCPGCAPGTLALFDSGFRDPRVAAIAPLAGMIQRDMWGETGEASVDVPVMSMLGSADGSGHAEQFESFSGIEVAWVELPGACHESFASGLPCAGLDTETGFSWLGTYLLAFGRRHVLGDVDPTVLGITDGSVVIDPGITVATKGP
jgi:predicted dienelactone hydrolase